MSIANDGDINDVLKRFKDDNLPEKWWKEAPSKFQTRGGHEVIMFNVGNPDSIFNKQAVIKKSNGDLMVIDCNAYGLFDYSKTSQFDIILKPVKHRIKGWLGIYAINEKSGCVFSESREQLLNSFNLNLIASIPIDVEFTEGEGLED